MCDEIEITQNDLQPDNLLQEVLTVRLRAVRSKEILDYKTQQNLEGISTIALAQKKLVLEEKAVNNANDFAIKFNQVISGLTINPFGADVLGKQDKLIKDPSLPNFEFVPGEDEKGIIDIPYDVVKD